MDSTRLEFYRRYDIRRAKKADIPLIMKFIDCYWKKEHIMSRDRMLFEYEYLDGEDVNFIVAIDKASNTLEGIFGFLNCSNTSDISKKDIWGSMWKVNSKHNNMPLLGIELARVAVEVTECRMQIGTGANPDTTVPLRKLFFREKTKKMNHYYRLNNNIKDYIIAEINSNFPKTYEDKRGVYLEEYKCIEEVMANFEINNFDTKPYKDSWYVDKRFYQHPYYEYLVYGIKKEQIGKTEALIIMRIVEYNGHHALRIVDYYGNQEIFGGLGFEFERLLNKYYCEYIDFYTLGFNEQYILEAGMQRKRTDDENIIPNFFEPFVKENIDIWVHYKYDDTLFFKADGDQDRPNIIKKRK